MKIFHVKMFAKSKFFVFYAFPKEEMFHLHPADILLSNIKERWDGAKSNCADIDRNSEFFSRSHNLGFYLSTIPSLKISISMIRI